MREALHCSVKRFGQYPSNGLATRARDISRVCDVHIETPSARRFISIFEKNAARRDAKNHAPRTTEFVRKFVFV